MNNNDFTSPIVNALQNEHNELFARTRSLDTRASILISILLAVLPFYFEILNWSYLKECFTCKCMSFKDICMSSFFCISIIALIVSLFFCVVVLFARKYYTFPSGNYRGFNLHEYEEIRANINLINTSIIASYASCTTKNTMLVEKKAKKFMVAIVATALYVVSVLISLLINLL